MGRQVLSSAEIKAERLARVNAEKSGVAFTLDKPCESLFCSFRISILPKVLTRGEVWFFPIVHIVLWVLKQQGYDMFSGGSEAAWALPLSFASVGVASGLNALLLVFFNQQCYARYVQLYGACTGMAGACQELAQISCRFAQTSQLANYRWDACRYLTTSVLTVYMRVTDLAANRTPALDPEDWDRLTMSEETWLGTSAPKGKNEMPPLLDEREVTVLKRCGGKEFQVLQMWSLEAMWQVYCRAGEKDNFREVEEIILACRKNCATIPNILDMPIPFPYYHALCMLQFANYTLYVFAFLDLDSWLTPIALFLIVITGTGVRELSSALANPFGDDEVDFNSTRFMHKMRAVVTFIAHPSCVADWANPYATIKEGMGGALMGGGAPPHPPPAMGYEQPMLSIVPRAPPQLPPWEPPQMAPPQLPPPMPPPMPPPEFTANLEYSANYAPAVDGNGERQAYEQALRVQEAEVARLHQAISNTGGPVLPAPSAAPGYAAPPPPQQAYPPTHGTPMGGYYAAETAGGALESAAVADHARPRERRRLRQPFAARISELPAPAEVEEIGFASMISMPTTPSGGGGAPLPTPVDAPVVRPGPAAAAIAARKRGEIKRIDPMAGHASANGLSRPLPSNEYELEAGAAGGAAPKWKVAPPGASHAKHSIRPA